MKIIKKENMVENVKITVTIEPSDVGKSFEIIPVHIPYSMGCGANVDIEIEETGSINEYLGLSNS